MLILLFTLVLIVLGVCTINLSSLNLTENERRLLYISDGDEQTDNEDFNPEKAEQETDPNFENDFNNDFGNDFGRDLGEDFDLSFSPDPTPKGKEDRQSDPRRHRHPEDLEMEEEMRRRHRHPDDFEFRDRDRRAAKSRIMKDLDEENIDLNKFNSEEEALNLTKQIYEKR